MGFNSEFKGLTCEKRARESVALPYLHFFK